MAKKKDIIVVGGGLAGLSAAHLLEAHNCNVTLLEKSDRLGGRVRTDHEHGFTLDVGFQVLLTSYPEVSRIWQRSLNLNRYNKGAWIRTSNEWKLIANPFCDPRALFKLPHGSLRGISSLLTTLFSPPQSITTDACIDALSASTEWRDNFLKPFMRGVLLDPDLSAPASRFSTLMKYFLKGSATLPRGGMEEIPNWLSNQLCRTKVRLNSEVVETSPSRVSLASGDQLTADAVLLALPLPALERLIHGIAVAPSLSTINDYFAIEDFAKADRYLWLDGDKEAPINNFSFPSAVQSSYSPKGQTLLSSSSIGDTVPTVDSVRDYIAHALNILPQTIKPIKRYIIPHALPSQLNPPPLKNLEYEGLFIAGEAVSPPSINDALASGRRAAHHLLENI